MTELRAHFRDMETPLRRLKGGLATLHELATCEDEIEPQIIAFTADSLDEPVAWIDRLFWEVYRNKSPAQSLTGSQNTQTPPVSGTDLRPVYEDMRREIKAVDSRERSDEEMNRRCAGINDARDRLAKAPAQTFDDVLLKLQEIEYVIQEWGLDTSWHKPLLRTAREGLERLTKEGQS